jgi:AraC-like DNA-binding protein
MLTSTRREAAAKPSREAGGRGDGHKPTPRGETSPPRSETAPLCSATSATAAARLGAFSDGQKVLREALAEVGVEQLTGLTGLQLHEFWHQPLDSRQPGKMPVVCPRARRRVDAGGELPTMCRLCLNKYWTAAALMQCTSPLTRLAGILCASRARGKGEAARFIESGGSRFVGRCKATNLHVTLMMDDSCLLTLTLQAPIIDADSAPIGVGPVSQRAFDDASRVSPFLSPAVPEAAFRTAEALLRLLLRDLETILYARHLEAEQHRAQRCLQHLRAESAHLRQELQRRVPEVPTAPTLPASRTHAEQVVEAMLHYLRQHYQRPLALHEVATHLGMNANYLSNLFHVTTGTTFHQYLEHLRLVRAAELLRDPCAHVCEVARAVGYVSPNHFRSVFKAHEGLPPTRWRETAPATGGETS